MNLRSVDLNLLVVLDSLLTERSVTRAAERLFMSQPATSNALRRLRVLFKDPLLVRTAGAMELTPRAAALARPVADTLRHMEALLNGPPRFDPSTAPLRIHVAASEYVAYVLLPPLLERLRAAAPHASVALSDVDRRNPLGQLYAGKVDIVCACIPDPPTDLHCQILFADRWVCIAKRRHPAIRGRLTMTRFSELHHAVMPMQTGGYASNIGNMLLEHGISRRVVLSAPHWLAIPEAICRSDLVMTTTGRLAAAFSRTHPIRVLPHPLRLPVFTVSAFWHDRTQADPGHRWLRDALSAVARALPSAGRARANA